MTDQPIPITTKTGRDSKGRFAPGNSGGPGGPRPGSGRKPKPSDPSLLDRLYETLDESAPKALKVLDNALRSDDEKTRVKAAELILRKVLPDRSMLDMKTEADDDRVPDRTPEETEIYKEMAERLARLHSQRANNG